MDKKPKIFYSPCGKCMSNTRHEVLCEILQTPDDGDPANEYYSVINCLGCETKSYRTLYQDIGHAYQDENDDWNVPEYPSYYPKYRPATIDFNINLIPPIVRQIYKESVLAFNEEAFILAGLGFRGTVEAICNDRNIARRSLDIRISRLATQGLISSEDAKRLHAIRFLGNDAAHDIKPPTSDQLSVAFKIINHLLQSVYLLNLEMDGQLETVVTKFEELKELLSKKVKTLDPWDEMPLSTILGKDARRLGRDANTLERLLIKEINGGSYKELMIGKVAKQKNSEEMAQYFIPNWDFLHPGEDMLG